MNKRIYILLGGGSGSGKTVLGQHLLELGIPELISHTTREPRSGEVPDETYHYVSQDEFDRLEKLEYTEYPKGSGTFYCLSKHEVEDKLAKYDVVFAITDKYGVRQFRKAYPGYVKVIYVYTTVEELGKRMVLRGDSPDKIVQRLQYVVDGEEQLNYQYANYIIENIDLDESKNRLETILQSDRNGMEIERKFLLKDFSNLNSLLHKEIVQGYLTFEPEKRIRREGENYYLTQKEGEGLTRKETQREIPREEYESLVPWVMGSLVQKTRYLLLQGNQRIEIDVYDGRLHGLVVAEVEFLNEEEAKAFKAPNWFGREVTYEKEYKNAKLALA